MRRSARYPGTIEELRLLVEYDPIDCVVRYVGPFKAAPYRDSTTGHVMLKVPIDVMKVGRGEREAKYFRMDHLVWALTRGEWPDGWIEHLNGMRNDCNVDNLVHLDSDGVRWWQCGGELVEVQANENGPITHVIIEGPDVFIVPKLVGVTYDEDNEPVDGAIAPRPEGMGTVSEVPDPG